MEIEEFLKMMIDMFDNVPKELQVEQERQSEIDLELTDIAHYLEIHTLKSYELAKVGKLMKSKREKRRTILNNIERLKTIKEFTDKYNQKLITGDIIKLLKRLEDLKKKQNAPIYSYRTDVMNDFLGEEVKSEGVNNNEE